jgi:uncharacterized protein
VNSGLRGIRTPNPMQALVIDGIDRALVEVAATSAARRTGLLGRDSIDQPMWLPGIRSVHTVRMVVPIDVAHVDATGTVVSVTTMVPNRIGRWSRRAFGVLEAAAGTLDAWRVGPGSSVRVGQWPAN